MTDDNNNSQRIKNLIEKALYIIAGYEVNGIYDEAKNTL